MGLNPKTVEHQNLQTTQSLDGRRRNLTEVRRVSKIVEAISNHRQAAVDHFQRRHFQIMPEAERRAGDHRMRNNQRQTAAKVRRFKDVFEDAANIDPGPLVRVETERAVAKVKRANVVETEDVIGVTVRNQHRIEMFQTSAERLLPKISGSIDDDRLPGVLDQDRDTQTLVARIVRRAGFAVTRNRRNARGCAGAEEGQFHFVSLVVSSQLQLTTNY